MATVTPREILEMAIRMERSGREFYAAAAEVVRQPWARELLAELGQDEVEHEALFRTILDRGDFEALARRPAPDDLRLADYLVQTAIGPESTPQDVLVVAIRMEKAAADLYGAWLRMYEGTGLEPILSGLVQEELRHKERLEKVYEDLFLKDW